MTDDETAFDTLITKFSQNIRQIEAAIDRAPAAERPEIGRKLPGLDLERSLEVRKKVERAASPGTRPLFVPWRKEISATRRASAGSDSAQKVIVTSA